MTRQSLQKIFEHNNWANLQIIQVCSTLTDQQLDAEPKSATPGSIRTTLFHLVNSQQGYLRLLTTSLEERLKPIPAPSFSELKVLATTSGEALLALARDEAGISIKGQLRTTDDFLVEPWVVMVQIINHATEHREQIKSMLSALGVTPPDIDGWSYGEFTAALIPIKKENKG
jgi:uncharacterized damage-inducible protein DinB